jgi:AcrR family transcriptional regulator
MPRLVKDRSPGNRDRSGPADDGRNTRWDSHREARRAELVEAAVAAIDEHGPSASIADIAVSAGVSKPVLYRYFSDKDDLYRAVGHWGADQVVQAIVPTLMHHRPLRERVERASHHYLTLISRHPNVFFLLVEHPNNQDPFADGKEMIAAAFARTLNDGLAELGVDTSGAEPWAYGVLGFGLSTGEWWLRRRTMSKAAVSRHLSSFIWNAFEGIARENGVRIDAAGRLSLVSGKEA